MAARDPYQKKMDKKVEKLISRISDENELIDEIAQVRGWFRPDLDNLFYLHIQSYLNGEANITETIRRITEPIDAALSMYQPDESHFWDLWYSVLHSAKKIPFRNPDGHTKLVELVQAYKAHPFPPDKRNNPPPSDERVTDTYSSLFMFGWASRETYNDSPGTGAGFFVPEIHAWTNVNYFWARLTATNEERLDFWLYCLWSMRSGLEDDYEGRGEGRKDMLDGWVPAAAVWVLTLGKELYQKQEEHTPKSENEGDRWGGGPLWEGKSELSKARWALWKKRFAEISEVENLREETRSIAKEAFEAMDAAEKSVN